MFIALPKFKIVQKLIDKLNLVSRENLSGLMVVRAFGNQEYEEARFDRANIDLTRTNLFINRVVVFMMPVMMFIMNGVMVLIIWVGAQHIAVSSIQIGDMMAFMQYAMQIIMSFLMMSMLFIILPRAAVSAERVNEVLDTEILIKDPEVPLIWDEHLPAKERGLVEFADVSFRYPDAEENALHNITFTAKPGTTTAIIGSTGSGKSTIANLMLRFHDVTSGSIKIDGIDLRDLAFKDIRAVIGYVPQKGVLMSGTIASNVSYGRPDATDEEMVEVAEVAQSIDFINEKEHKFDSEIAQGGSNVSGGQKQRLAIMRALLKKPHILIFDDSFSALDYRTDSKLRKALHQYASNTTQIIIAQRVSTIMQAEQIIVLDNGEIVGMGTHQELLISSPTYYEIASSQLSKEELR
jgi:ATP-binding cassette subfamily B protein